MRVFVSGGSGFIGRHFIENLVKRGDEVVALAHTGLDATIVEGLGAEPVRGDLANLKGMREPLRGCEAVFHLGAKVDMFGDRDSMYRVNVLGTRRLGEAARDAGVPRFVYLSTAAAAMPKESASSRPITEADDARSAPVGPYPMTKAEAEAAARNEGGRDMAVIALRPPLVWGPNDTSSFPKFREVVTRNRFVWFGGGAYPISTCHVSNVCEGLILAAENGAHREAYFITDGEPVIFREFFSRLMEAHGLEVQARSLPYAAAYTAAGVIETAWKLLPLKGRPPITRAIVRTLGRPLVVDDSKARQELGYQGAVSMDAGFAALKQAVATQPVDAVT